MNRRISGERLVCAGAVPGILRRTAAAGPLAGNLVRVRQNTGQPGQGGAARCGPGHPSAVLRIPMHQYCKLRLGLGLRVTSLVKRPCQARAMIPKIIMMIG